MKNIITNFSEFINEHKINEEMAQLREHSWTKDDTILTLYYVKYGLKNIPVNDEKELAEWIIGASKVSLDRQAANIRYLLGYDPSDNYVLDAYSALQSEVVEEYGKMDRGQLQSIVENIIMKTDKDKNKQIIKAKAMEKDKKIVSKRHKEASNQALEDALRRMGKDPSKFKSLGRRDK